MARKVLNGLNIAGGDISPLPLSTLSDVTITSGIEGDLLQLNSSGEWVNVALDISTKQSASYSSSSTAYMRIAESALNIGSNAGIFKLKYSGTSSGEIVFRAVCINGNNAYTSFTVLYQTGAPGYFKPRLVYHTTPTGNYAYVEIYIAPPFSFIWEIELVDSIGWTLNSAYTAGGTPSGYTAQECYSYPGMGTMGQLFSGVPTGSSPLIVASTTKVTNLNADMLDDKHASEFPANSTFRGTGTVYANSDDTYSSGCNRFNKLIEDFVDLEAMAPLTFAALGGGTYVDWSLATDGHPNHPGLSALKSTATNPSGGVLSTASKANYIRAYEELEVIFNLQSVAATKTHYIGRHNALSADAVAPTYGIYIKIVNNVLTGYHNTTATGTSYTVSTSTWYRLAIVVNSAKTIVTFTIYNESGTSLWSQSIALTLYTGLLPLFAAKVVSTSGVASDLIILDYFSYDIPHVLTR